MSLLRSLVLSATLIFTINGEANPQTAQPGPQLHSIRMVTISSEDPERSADHYKKYLGYIEIERGSIPMLLAMRWEAPNTAGRPYVLLSAVDSPDVFIRFIQVQIPKDYQAMRSAGWNALEILSRDPYQAHDHLKSSNFVHLDGPAPLEAGSSIHAVQYLGMDNEVLYFTADLGSAKDSTLARTTQIGGRPFIVILAGDSISQIGDFYGKYFGLAEAFRMQTPVPLIARAQQRNRDHIYELALLRLSAFSHSIEVDEYPQAPPRAAMPGELPPGIAIVSFCTSAVAIEKTKSATQSLVKPDGLAYGHRSTRVLRGPAGELIELINCR